MRLSRLVSAGAVALALAAGGLGTSAASAAAARPRAHPLIVTAGPVRQVVKARPGHAVRVRLLLDDLSKVPLTVRATVTGFTEDRGGQFGPAAVERSEAGWLSLPAVIRLAPQHAVHVSARLAVPRRAAPGDAALAVLFSAVPDGRHQKVSASLETVPAVLLQVIVRVPGRAVSRLGWHLAGGLSLLGGPVQLRASVAETGTAVAVENGLRLQGTGIALPGALLLPGTARAYAADWQPPMLGCMLGCRVTFGTATAEVYSEPVLPAVAIIFLAAAIWLGWLVLRRRPRPPAGRQADTDCTIVLPAIECSKEYLS